MATRNHSNKKVYSYFCLSDVDFIELLSYIGLRITIHDKHVAYGDESSKNGGGGDAKFEVLIYQYNQTSNNSFFFYIMLIIVLLYKMKVIFNKFKFTLSLLSSW
jgi:hypothetical protein